MKNIFLILLFLFLSACGGSDNNQAEDSDIKVQGHVEGNTPFVSFLTLSDADAKKLKALGFSIATKPGNFSNPIDVTYSSSWLTKRGYLTETSSAVTVPVVGLYSGSSNSITVRVYFIDGSTKTITTTIVTNPYADPLGVLDKVSVVKKLDGQASLGFSYFGTKPFYGLPAIIDTDGEIRWVAGSSLPAFNSFAYAWDSNGFLVGSDVDKEFRRYELDGQTSSGNVVSPTYTSFHHKIEAGKTGLLGEFAIELRQNGDAIAEFSPTGEIVKEWNVGAIISSFMLSLGDDPTLFVRPGFDWFHSNSVMYDPRDDSIVVSSRENFVIKLDYSTGSIKWILGDPTKYWYSFASLRSKALTLNVGGLYPMGQHSLSVHSSGDLMIFNNGFGNLNQPAGQTADQSLNFSTVSRYSIDATTLSATETWRFENNRSIYSDICSSANEGDGRSLLITYSAANARTKARIVGLNSLEEVAFDLEYPSPGCQHFWNTSIIPLDRLKFD